MTRLAVKLGELRPGPVREAARVWPGRVDLGSLASCPSCGGLVSLRELAFGLVAAWHLSGDVFPDGCPRRGLGWSRPGLHDLDVERDREAGGDR